MGRPKLDDKKVIEAMAYVKAGMTVCDAAKRVGISRQSLYNYGVVEVRNAAVQW